MKRKPIPSVHGRWSRLLAGVCLALLLVASTVEAAHFCGLNGSRSAVQAAAPGADTGSPGFCVICATAHQASMSAAVAHVAPTTAVVATTLLTAVQSRSRLQVFTMDVRPPPSV